MSGLQVPKRIHIVPLGYEEDRIVKPVLSYDADEVLLLEPDPDSEEIHRPEYHERVRDQLRNAGIEIETIECNIFNLYSSLGTIAELANEFREHNVYVNLASGSKVTAIGGMIACMATGAIPYYVRAETYAGGDERPVASGVKKIETLPKYHIEEPEPQHISILDYVTTNEPVTKHNLIEYGKHKELPFIARYDADGVQNPDRGYYRRLNTQIINPLLNRGFIDVEKHSKYQYVTVTESGSNQLQAFRYLLKS
ncbi:DUF6293 family protein [Halopenitus sp. H-Gu1]|uniref:HFX_2341 family transcriptional regulator domain-containing protein n=1 Tax=Halopenitus sp. H-Gu1 TaxID=3242697 RepID=UPI00359E069E